MEMERSAPIGALLSILSKNLVVDEVFWYNEEGGRMEGWKKDNQEQTW